MFYCETCRKAEGWPDSGAASTCMCEICGTLAMCWNMPASKLPPKRQKQATPAWSRKDGGPAFPMPSTFFGDTDSQDTNAQLGMSLRDWFAGQALARLAGLLTSDGGKSAEQRAAAACYRYADALLAERERTEPQ